MKEHLTKEQREILFNRSPKNKRNKPTFFSHITKFQHGGHQQKLSSKINYHREMSN